jgi:hypothetical protein
MHLPRTALASLLTAGAALAQQPASATAQRPIGFVPTDGVTLTGPLSVANGQASIGNNTSVSAGDKTAQITLTRGGRLRICASTSVHLSKDALPLTSAAPGANQDDAGLMIALDRGALEANYTAGKYSDVLLTPDLRILISGPGTADVKLRVNRQGDTCVDNHGLNAPYVTVSSLMDGGVYRVQPDQRVLFEHGSLQQVVDSEAEPCGCPDEAPANPALVAGKPIGGPSSTPADTAFPTAVSEGLASPPPTPAAPAGQAHAQVTATLSKTTPPGPPPPDALEPAASPAPAPRPAGLLHRIGHFFARIFG